MSGRKDFYYRQPVTEAELNEAFDYLEQADRSIVADLGFTGVYSGLAVTQHAGTPNLTVDVSAGGAYDPAGQRIAVPSVQTVDLSVDSNNASTAVAVSGNARVVSLFAVFNRVLSDPRVDGNNDTVYFDRAESFEFRVVMGAEAVLGSEVAPALAGDAILLADVQLLHTTTQILNAAINSYIPNRRQNFDLIGPNSIDINALIATALAAAPTITNAIITGSSTRIATTAMTADGNARGKIYSNVTNIDTTDATVTTAYSFPILDECITTLTLQLSAIKSDGSQWATFGISVVIQRDGGTVTVGFVNVFRNEYSTAFAALSATVDNSGSTARVRVTGRAATSIDWVVVASRLEHTHP